MPSLKASYLESDGSKPQESLGIRGPRGLSMSPSKVKFLSLLNSGKGAQQLHSKRASGLSAAMSNFANK